ncbi:hypothetical protein THAOC_17643, partial [Thalassiosira oceanica]
MADLAPSLVARVPPGGPRHPPRPLGAHVLVLRTRPRAVRLRLSHPLVLWNNSPLSSPPSRPHPVAGAAASLSSSSSSSPAAPFAGLGGRHERL